MSIFDANEIPSGAPIEADKQAIKDLINNDPAVIAARQQFKDDLASTQATIKADLELIKADRQQLFADLKAEREDSSTAAT